LQQKCYEYDRRRMLNLTSMCDITRRGLGEIDSDTGLPSIAPVVVYSNVRCAFTLLTAAEHAEIWGDGGQPTETTTTKAHLVLPAWIPDLLDGYKLADYRFTVDGTDWFAEAVKAQPDWTSPLVSQHN
jgi:hypothetical protein